MIDRKILKTLDKVIKLDFKLNLCYNAAKEVCSMNLIITKSARQFGYLIWNGKNLNAMEKMLEGRESISVIFNGFVLGEKNIDRKYHRISLGYKLTRAMPEDHNIYSVKIKDGVLEVRSLHGND